MKIMSRPRAGGKTYHTMQWVREDPGGRAVVVSSEERKTTLMRKYELTDDQVIVPSSLHRPTRRVVRIDDLDFFLERVGFPYVDGFTIGPVELI